MDGNVFLIMDKHSCEGFLHTGKYFIDFVRVGLLANNQCHLSRESDRFIYSVPPLDDSEEKTVVVNRTKALGWERFDLHPTPYNTDCLFDKINIIADSYFSSDAITSIFKKISVSNLQEKSVVLEKLLELMSNNELETLSRYYYDNIDELKHIAKISGDMHFIESAKQFDSKERKKSRYYIDETLDFIADRHFIKSFSSNKWMHLNYHIRKTHNPINKLCIVATAKNEGVYLLEWISYYINLGVDAIFIYSNGNDDGSDELLQALHKAGIIRYLENKVDSGCSAQNKAYTHALTINKDILNYEWSLFIDLDEFMVINDSMFSSITDFLDWHNRKDVHAIALNWIFSIPEKDSDWINKPITERLTKFDKNTNGHIKTVLKPHFFSSSFPHHPLSINDLPFTYRTASGGLHIKSTKHNNLSISNNPSNSHAAILHYFNRSIPEFIWKYSRNRGDHPNVISNESFTESLLPFLKFFMSSIDSKSHVNSSLYLPKNINIASSINELLKDENINHSYQEVKNRTKQRYEKIYNLFWEFLEEKKKCSEHAKDIEAFMLRFH